MDKKNKSIKLIILSVSCFVIVLTTTLLYMNFVGKNSKALEEHFFSTFHNDISLLNDDINTFDIENSKYIYQKGKMFYQIARNSENDSIKDKFSNEVIKNFSKLLKFNFENPDKTFKLDKIFFYTLAQSFMLKGERYYDVALTYYKIFERLNEGDEQLEYKKSLAFIYFKLDDFENAEKYYQEVVKNESNIIEKLYYGLTLIELHKVDEAVVQINDFLSDGHIRNEELKLLAYKKLGDIYYQKGKYEKALSNYNSIIKMEENKDYLANIYDKKGNTYEKLSNTSSGNEKKEYLDIAFSEWRKAYELSPDKYSNIKLKYLKYGKEFK